MIPRIRSQRPNQCSEESWRALLFAMNKNDDEVRLRREQIEECLACHRQHDPRYRLEGKAVGRVAIEVDRMKLFAFVQEHGEVCGKPQKEKAYD